MAKEDNSRVGDLAENLKRYISARLEIFKLNAVAFGTNTISGFLKFLVVGTLTVVGFLFLGLALAFWLGELLDHTFAGFLIVGGFFLLITIVVAKIWKSTIKSRIMKSLLELIPDEQEEDQ